MAGRDVAAVGEAFTNDPETGVLTGANQRRRGRRKQNQRTVERGNRSDDGAGKVRVAGGHVVQRAMWLHMAERSAFRAGHPSH